jgi:RNA polymerase sigma-70 factor, ECF subfamily
MSEMDDARLLEQARRGDEEAFSRLFQRYQQPILRYGAYMCGRDGGEDIVQETFLAILRQTTRHDPPRSTVVAYLLGIARHMVMKRLAGRKDSPFVEPIEDGLRAPAREATVLDDLTRAETIRQIRAAVHSLPPDYREVVVLCELQGMDYAAAADVMQCPIGTVRSRLHRARMLLSTKLAAAAGRPRVHEE